jgi:hypothetical protein
MERKRNALMLSDDLRLFAKVAISPRPGVHYVIYRQSDLGYRNEDTLSRAEFIEPFYTKERLSMDNLLYSEK